MANDPFEACARAVRKYDPDRYFSALFAPADKRPFLFALYALNHELAHVAESIREPMIGEIRLQWWRETLESARAGNPRAHDVVRGLALTFATVDLPASLLDAIIDARSFDLNRGPFPDDASRDEYLDATSGNLMRLAAKILGPARDDLAHEAGLAYGLAGLLRNQAIAGREILPDAASAKADALSHLAKARRMKKAGVSLAAFLPASLVPLYVRNPAKDTALHRKQLRLLSCALRGRV
ncbi:MAG TPA: squalene/phytoene synthase family protein [Rhizomicrobium sp.]|nr:squalene/phytoene synthase family protein [Rhizomicrobium sp.]